MFHRRDNASKVALVHLVRGLAQKRFDLIDCQVTTAHLVRFGAREIPRREFMARLKKAMRRPTLKGPWHIMDGGLYWLRSVRFSSAPVSAFLHFRYS